MDKVVREHTTARVKTSIIEAVKSLAEKEGRSYSNMLEWLLLTHPKIERETKQSN